MQQTRIILMLLSDFATKCLYCGYASNMSVQGVNVMTPNLWGELNREEVPMWVLQSNCNSKKFIYLKFIETN